MRVHYSITHNRGEKVERTAYAMTDSGNPDSAAAAVAASLARKNGLEICAGPRSDGWSSGGSFYEITLGRPTGPRSWQVAAEVGFCIESE